MVVVVVVVVVDGGLDEDVPGTCIGRATGLQASRSIQSGTK